MPLYSTKYGRIYPKRRRRTSVKMVKGKSRRKHIAKIKQNIHYFKVFAARGTISGSSGQSETRGIISFKLTDIANYAEYVALYDSFKLVAVAVSFIPLSNVTQYANTADFQQTSFANRIFTVFDYNDGTAPTSLAQLREYKSCRWSPGNRIHKRFIYPKVTLTIDEDANTGSSYGLANSTKNPWMSTGFNQTQFYGIKYGIHHPTLGQSTDLYQIECRYYLKFKSPK